MRQWSSRQYQLRRLVLQRFSTRGLVCWLLLILCLESMMILGRYLTRLICRLQFCQGLTVFLLWETTATKSMTKAWQNILSIYTKETSKWILRIQIFQFPCLKNTSLMQNREFLPVLLKFIETFFILFYIGVRKFAEWYVCGGQAKSKIG